MTTPPASDIVFNVVWTGEVFSYLQLFAASVLDRSPASVRFVANGCPPQEIALMERFHAAHPDRVVEVIDVSPEVVAHGVALDRVRSLRHDGPHFCLLDPDIKANGPFLDTFLQLREDNAVVTSGTEVWSTDNVLPLGHPGVAGEHFFDQNGFCFGSPHLALYDREVLDETTSRWKVGLGSAGPDLESAARARLADVGYGEMLVFDTAKIVNILIQGDGYRLVHRDLPQLVHIGGLAHYLAPSEHRLNQAGELEPDWARYETMAARHAVTRFTALTLRSLAEGTPRPPVPRDIEPDLAGRLEMARDEVVDLVDRYSGWMVS